MTRLYGFGFPFAGPAFPALNAQASSRASAGIETDGTRFLPSAGGAGVAGSTVGDGCALAPALPDGTSGCRVHAATRPNSASDAGRIRMSDVPSSQPGRV